MFYPYENFNCLEDYQKQVDDLKKEDFCSKLKNKCPSDEEKEKTKKTDKLFNFKNEEELLQRFITCTCFWENHKYRLKKLVWILSIVWVYLVILGIVD